MKTKISLNPIILFTQAGFCSFMLIAFLSISSYKGYDLTKRLIDFDLANKEDATVVMLFFGMLLLSAACCYAIKVMFDVFYFLFLWKPGQDSQSEI